MAQLFETLCMMLAFKESHSLAMHYCRLVWDVRSLSKLIYTLYLTVPALFPYHGEFAKSHLYIRLLFWILHH